MQCRVKLYLHGEDVQCVHRAPHHFKVVLEDGDRPGQGLMSAATEQSHARIQQDGGYERRVWDSTQAFDAALKASLTNGEMRMETITQQKQQRKHF